MLRFDEQAEFEPRGDEPIFRLIRKASTGKFAEQIIADLIKQELSEDELMAAFKQEQAQICPAVEAILTEAENVAAGIGEYENYDALFISQE